MKLKMTLNAAHEYMVKVNCEENLIELMEVHQDTLMLEGREHVTETLPQKDINGNYLNILSPRFNLIHTEML